MILKYSTRQEIKKGKRKLFKKNLRAIGIVASAPVSMETNRILDIPLYVKFRMIFLETL